MSTAAWQPLTSELPKVARQKSPPHVSSKFLFQVPHPLYPTPQRKDNKDNITVLARAPRQNMRDTKSPHPLPTLRSPPSAPQTSQGVKLATQTRSYLLSITAMRSIITTPSTLLLLYHFRDSGRRTQITSVPSSQDLRLAQSSFMMSPL